MSKVHEEFKAWLEGNANKPYVTPKVKRDERVIEDLHERIAEALKWDLKDVQSFSLSALKEFVRPIDKELMWDIQEAQDLGTHLLRSRK